MILLFYCVIAVHAKKIQSSPRESYLLIRNAPNFLESKTFVELEFYCSRNLFLVLYTTFIIGNERKFYTEGIEFLFTIISASIRVSVKGFF